ncbi:MAG: GNAT family N-acetyltransferase [Clostridiales bacterium]|nr:GNAT family N-acetyltransferase [Clostridiales bacterium]
MHIRRSTPADLPAIHAIYADARAFMRECGNPTQWRDDYPPAEYITRDCAPQGHGYVCEENGQILAAFYYLIEEEPTYAYINGAWQNDAPYGVVHRIAVRRDTKGIGTYCLQWALAQCGNLRIDTHRDNAPMLALLRKLGFAHCGTIWVRDGKDARAAFQKEGKMHLHIRPETPADHYAVEALTREAFWEFWEPNQTICNEHLLVHRLRVAAALVPELNFVAEADGEIVGHIIYTRSSVTDDAGQVHETLTFGPLSVLPGYQNRGIGRALMRHSFEAAKQLGHKAVLIFGNPDFYPRVGFRPAKEFGIALFDGPGPDSFMAYPLCDGALNDIRGRHSYDPVYTQLTEEDTCAFDQRFPPKAPFMPTPIRILLEQLESEAAAALAGIDCPSLQMMTAYSEREIAALPGMNGQAIEIIRAVLRGYGVRWGL